MNDKSMITMWLLVVLPRLISAFTPTNFVYNPKASRVYSNHPFVEIKTSFVPGWHWKLCSLSDSEEEESVSDIILNGAGDKGDASRRSLLKRAIANLAIFSAASFTSPTPSSAGLVQFPCTNLLNTYHIMRAGQSLLESEDVLSTNPLFLTNRDDALSDLGVEQVQRACKDMLTYDINPSVVKYSLAAKAMDTANIVATEMKIGRNRLIPEYTFMDPRGIGKWDMRNLSTTETAIWAMDNSEAGSEGRGGRPPPNDDGTPNEVLFDQVIRLRQLMSVLETQFSGDTILLIFPDGTGPALLTSLIGGIPLNRAHELNFIPGEVRYDITKDSALNMLPSKPLLKYTEKIMMGEDELEKLRNEDLLLLDTNEELYHTEVEMVAAESRLKSTGVKKGFLETTSETDKLNQHNLDHLSQPQDSKNETYSVGRQPDFFSFPSLLLAGFLATWFPSKDTRKELNLEESSNNSASLSLDLPDNNEREDKLENFPELQKIETLVSNAPFDVPDFKSHESGDGLVVETDYLSLDMVEFERDASSDSLAKVEEKEKIELAKKAMDEYLNEDDGGEEWLISMSVLMNED